MSKKKPKPDDRSDNVEKISTTLTEPYRTWSLLMS